MHPCSLIVRNNWYKRIVQCLIGKNNLKKTCKIGPFKRLLREISFTRIELIWKYLHLVPLNFALPNYIHLLYFAWWSGHRGKKISSEFFSPKNSFFSTFHAVPVILAQKIFPQSLPNYRIIQLSDKKVVGGKVVCRKWLHILNTWRTFYNLQNGGYIEFSDHFAIA